MQLTVARTRWAPGCNLLRHAGRAVEVHREDLQPVLKGAEPAPKAINEPGNPVPLADVAGELGRAMTDLARQLVAA